MKQRWNPDNFPFGRRADKKTIIVCQGGGNFGDLYPYYQTFREKSSNPFRKTGSSSCRNRFIIRMRHGCKRHRRFCGAQGSPPVYERSCVIRDCETLFSANHIGLMPDMAHQLYPIAASAVPSRGRLYFIRTDGEINPKLQNNSSVKSCDWQDVLSASDRRGIAFSKR